MPTKKTSIIRQLPVALIERRIYLIRGKKVMIDSDLAELYGVPTYRLNEAASVRFEVSGWLTISEAVTP